MVRAILTCLLLSMSATLSVLEGPTLLSALPLVSERGGVAVLQVSVRDAAGHPIHARVRLRRLHALPWQRGVVAFATPARSARVQTAAGRYQLISTRGLEWSLDRRYLELAADSTTAVTVTLRHEASADGWLGADLHVHSDASPDCDVGADARIVSLAAEGLQFVASTDHNTVTHYDPTLLKTEGITLVPGVELTTWAPEIGHFNVFPIRRVPAFVGRSPGELFQELRRDPDRVVQVNHPRLDDHIAYFELGGLNSAGQFQRAGFSLDFDALEVWNGFDLAEPGARDRVFANWLALLCAGHRIVATGNSDSHDLQAQPPGYPRTYVEVAARERGDPLAFVRALKAGRAFVTSGPLVFASIAGKGPGATVQVPIGEAIELRVRIEAASWLTPTVLEVWVGRTRFVSEALDTRYPGHNAPVEVAFALPAWAADFVVVTVRARGPLDDLVGRHGAQPYAFTNPIWIQRVAPPDSRRSGATIIAPFQSQTFGQQGPSCRTSTPPALASHALE